MRDRKRKKIISSLSEFPKIEKNKKCQAMFGSFLAPSSTDWADESQERTKILLVISLRLQPVVVTMLVHRLFLIFYRLLVYIYK